MRFSRWNAIAALVTCAVAADVAAEPARAPGAIARAPIATVAVVARMPQVHITAVADPSNRVPPTVRERAGRVVRDRLARAGHAAGTRAAFVVSPAVTTVAIAGTTIRCDVVVRVAPASARGGETWEAERTAIAKGRAVATRTRDVVAGVESCVSAALEATVSRRVVPFLAYAVRR